MALKLSLLLFGAVSATAPAPCQEPEWPEYRGPNADGQAPEARVPLSWSEDENVAWKTAIHGRGWSSPVVGGGRVWLTTAAPEGHELSVLAVDLEGGDVLLDRVVFEVAEPEPINALNSYASPSPVLGGGCVFVSFGTYGTACLDAASGATRWQRRDLNCDHMEGPGSSPMLYAGLLVLHVDGGDVQYVVALDAESGETVWRTPRSIDLEPINPDMRKAYSTPVVVTTGGAHQLISSGAQATYGYDPATGQELWRVRHKGFSMSSRPLVGDGLVFVSTGFMRAELWALRLGGEGDVTESHVAWTRRRGIPTMPSAVLVDGRIYLVDDGGIASCLDAATGEEHWRERLGASHCASVIYAGGRVYFFDRTGVAVAVHPGERFEKLAESRLDAGFMASPAVIGDAFVLRTETHLYRVEKRAD